MNLHRLRAADVTPLQHTDPAAAAGGPPPGRRRGDLAAAPRDGAERGQAMVLLIGALLAGLIGAVILATIARGIGEGGQRQSAADLAALSGARAMQAGYGRLFEPLKIDGRPNPRHLDRATYLERGRVAAERTARLNGATHLQVTFPDGSTIAPVQIKVAVTEPVRVDAAGRHEEVPHRSVAEAELAPPAGGPGLPAGAGEYRGPLAYRQGKPMRPDVAGAFDRMAAAARADGVTLIINSAFRSNAEQAVLFAQHPDPKWVAPPGKSLHRLGTELDLGPSSAYGWLSAHAGAFHFVQRYSWEPWHYGYTLNAGTGSVGFGGDGSSSKTLQAFVPAHYAPILAHAASRWSVSANLLAAQIYAESGFNPFATSGAGAQGIAQFMPGTAAAMGLDDPFDAPAAIDAQAHLMRDLLRQFGSVPLALAAYNAGPASVQACGCVPDNGETAGYVARILGLLGGAGDATGLAGLSVRLIR